LKGIALQHFNSGGKVLAIDGDTDPQSIFRNPSLYPQMFPWLFPYGLGGIGSVEGMSDHAHKKWLLMYHDKRFQLDPYFPLVAFSHEQIKSSTTGGYLLADKKKFEDICMRFMSLDHTVLENLAKRMTAGERVIPKNGAEEHCFQVIQDLDQISSHVHGSTTSKKFMRNEIWSLIAHLGAPSWFITFAPADNHHPICIYFADTKEKFCPEIRSSDDRNRLIANNPVAGARFFNFMVEMFIKHVLGVGADHPGLYGETAGYYGVVEQQGRLTLHLHLLLWLVNALSPQEIRDRILDPDGVFQKKIIDYMESVHVGEFLTGTQDEVLDNRDHLAREPGYQNPMQTLPVPPPEECTAHSDESMQDESLELCYHCKEWSTWWGAFRQTVDDIVSRTTIHECGDGKRKNGTDDTTGRVRNCLNNKWGKCRARYPRKTFLKSGVDAVTGTLN
jgi:hypothetical protein